MKNVNYISALVTDIYSDIGIPELFLKPSIIILDVFFVIISVIFIYWIVKKFFLSAVYKVVHKTNTNWDNIFLENNVFKYSSYLMPVISIIYLTPIFLGRYPELIVLINNLSKLLLVWVFVKILTNIITSFTIISRGEEKYASIVIQSLSQLLKITIYVFAFIISISILLKVELKSIFGTLGALTAVIILVFKDTILGFVASIQVSTTKMLKIGDWVVMPSYSADGPLIELNLVTAKIQNWDKTITSVPTYALISSSVKNWQGMSEAGVRRIKRSMIFDVNSIHFLTEEEISHFMSFDLLKEYIGGKEIEMQEYNKNSSNPQVNGRKQTNIGVFRKYAELYISSLDYISKKHTLMVRQLQVSEMGLPIEIYCFSLDTEWVNYEKIQSDIFDHLFAIAEMFNLKMFQNPTGLDFKAMKEMK